MVSTRIAVRSAPAVRATRTFRLTTVASCLAVLVALAATGACGSSSSTPAPSPVVPFTSTDLVVGTGTEAASGKTLTVNYTGWLYDTNAADHKGTQFDTSVGKTPFSFVLGAGRVIAGWDQGLVGMKVGGQRRLVVPSTLAYGSSGNGPIPPNTALVFDVELINVQ